MKMFKRDFLIFIRDLDFLKKILKINEIIFSQKPLSIILINANFPELN